MARFASREEYQAWKAPQLGTAVAPPDSAASVDVPAVDLDTAAAKPKQFVLAFAVAVAGMRT